MLILIIMIRMFLFYHHFDGIFIVIVLGTLWQTNIAMENSLFLMGKSTINGNFQ
jgi:hypothetical protein